MNEKIDWKDVIIDVIRNIFPGLFTRPMFTLIRDLQSSNEISKDLVIVEIGTDLGTNARNIKQFISFDALYLVDPYFDNYGKYASGDERFEIAKKRVGVDNGVEFIRETSEDALKLFEDNSIDGLYIDGSHKEEDVKKDIEMWYLKVKEGGIIGGHDFFGSGLGVVLAVTDYVNENNLRKKLDGFGTDWWMRK